jgi:hypothetical protein
VLHALTLAGLALVAGAASAAAVGLTISEVDWANDISGRPCLDIRLRRSLSSCFCLCERDVGAGL